MLPMYKVNYIPEPTTLLEQKHELQFENAVVWL